MRPPSLESTDLRSPPSLESTQLRPPPSLESTERKAPPPIEALAAARAQELAGRPAPPLGHIENPLRPSSRDGTMSTAGPAFGVEQEDRGSSAAATNTSRHATSTGEPSARDAASSAPAAAPAKSEAEMLAAIRKMQAKFSENPANFHQAAAVYILGGGKVKLQDSFPRPENVSRMTRSEMQLAWEKAEETISKTEKLVCHFTDLTGAGFILGTDSPGFRASTVGQGGGGVYVASAGPHQLDWEQYQGGKFRETTGRALWGEKWHELLEGEKCANKVDMVFFIKIPEMWFTQAAVIPGRPLARVIPSSLLYEHDSHHYLQKTRIVKSYVLKKGASTEAPDLNIQGETAAEQQSLSMKLRFAFLSGAMVTVQALALVAIILATVAPPCRTNTDCSRRGTFCSPPRGWYAGGCKVLRDIECTPAQGIQDIECTPAAEVCGVGELLSGGEEQMLVHGGGRCQFCGDDSSWGLPDNSTLFCENEVFWRVEFCDEDSGFRPPLPLDADLDTQTRFLGQPSRPCPHPACRACKDVPGFGIPAKIWLNQPDRLDGNQMWGVVDMGSTFTGSIGSMKTSDFASLLLCSAIVSFSLAGELKDIKLVQITTFDRGRDLPFWRAYLLTVCIMRQYVVVPAACISVPILVLFDGGSSKNIALNTSVRTHTEEFGRADINEDQLRRMEAAKMWSWPLLAFAMVVPIIMAWYTLFHSCPDRQYYSSPGCSSISVIILMAISVLTSVFLNLFSGVAEAYVAADCEQREAELLRDSGVQFDPKSPRKVPRSKCIAVLGAVLEWFAGVAIITIIILYVYS